MMEWPEKKDSPKGRDCRCHAGRYVECICRADWSDNDPWNACLEQCKDSYAKEPKLVPITRTEIAFMVQEVVSEAHLRPEGSEMIDLIDKYEHKFGTPLDVPSVEELSNIVQNSGADWENLVDPITPLYVYIAQAIHSRLTKGKNE